MAKSPFQKKELEEFKLLLLEKKARILQEIQGQSASVQGDKSDEPGDLVDMATELLEQELNLSLTTSETNMIRDIDDALKRIEDGVYGVCIDTGEPIKAARLKAVPEAKRTLEAQEKFDKKQKDQKRKTT